MSQNADPKHENQQPIDWKSLDEVTRKWAALTGHENDQSWYQKMKEHYE